MPSDNPKPPPELLDIRPVLADEPHVYHPDTDPRLGKPPRKYTKAVHDVIVDELRRGQRAQGACARAGITLATFYDWIKKGKANDPWLYEFAEDVEIAFNSAEAQAVDAVTEGFRSTDPNLRNSENAKWFLERARSDGYSKQVKTAVENQIGDFMKRLEAALDPDTFLKVLAVYLGQTPTAALGAHQESPDGTPEEDDGTEK